MNNLNLVIYVLLLQKGYIYVGKTSRQRAIQDIILHQKAQGIPWTIKYPPVQILWDQFTMNAQPEDQDKTVIRLMWKYGFNRVRGGIYRDSINLNEYETLYVLRQIKCRQDMKFQRGKFGNFKTNIQQEIKLKQNKRHLLQVKKYVSSINQQKIQIPPGYTRFYTDVKAQSVTYLYQNGKIIEVKEKQTPLDHQQLPTCKLCNKKGHFDHQHQYVEDVDYQPICFNCFQWGHLAYDCKNRQVFFWAAFPKKKKQNINQLALNIVRGMARYFNSQNNQQERPVQEINIIQNPVGQSGRIQNQEVQQRLVGQSVGIQSQCVPQNANSNLYRQSDQFYYLAFKDEIYLRQQNKSLDLIAKRKSQHSKIKLQTVKAEQGQYYIKFVLGGYLSVRQSKIQIDEKISWDCIWKIQTFEKDKWERLIFDKKRQVYTLRIIHKASTPQDNKYLCQVKENGKKLSLSQQPIIWRLI